VDLSFLNSPALRTDRGRKYPFPLGGGRSGRGEGSRSQARRMKYFPMSAAVGGKLKWGRQLGGTVSLLTFESDVLQGGEGMQRNRVDRVIGYLRPYPRETPQVINGGKHHTLHGELLNAVQ
jgi:hypothetical protein